MQRRVAHSPSANNRAKPPKKLGIWSSLTEPRKSWVVVHDFDEKIPKCIEFGNNGNFENSCQPVFFGHSSGWVGLADHPQYLKANTDLLGVVTTIITEVGDLVFRFTETKLFYHTKKMCDTHTIPSSLYQHSNVAGVYSIVLCIPLFSTSAPAADMWVVCTTGDIGVLVE